MVEYLSVDVRYERGHRTIRERTFAGAARPGEAVDSQTLYALAPGAVNFVELGECLGRRARVGDAHHR